MLTTLATIVSALILIACLYDLRQRILFLKGAKSLRLSVFVPDDCILAGEVLLPALRFEEETFANPPPRPRIGGRTVSVLGGAASKRASGNLTEYDYRRGIQYGSWSYLPQELPRPCIVYGVGLGADMTFELELMTRHECRVWGFDISRFGARHVRRTLRNMPRALRKRFTFTPEGLAAASGMATVTVPRGGEGSVSFIRQLSNVTAQRVVDTLGGWMRRFGHTHVDLLKMVREAE